MSEVIEILASSLKNDLRAIDHIAQNLANVNTPGYKAISAAGSNGSFEKLLGQGEAKFHNDLSTSTRIDFSSGSLKPSERSLDIAIIGNAFLKVQSGSEVLFSKNGSLSISSEGELTDLNGRVILSDQGTIQVSQSGILKIAKNGEVTQNGTLLGQLDLVSFRDPTQVIRNGDGLLKTSISNLSEARDWVIHQGYIETSNVNNTHEMVRMMELSKHFESVQKALSVYDQALGTGINKIGK
jgi:flagellar basal-body rod protein FlgF